MCTLALSPAAMQAFNGAGAPYYHGPQNSNQIALLCNVYMGSEYVEQLLAIAQTHQVPITFFVGGVWAKDNAALLQRIVQDGHEIGNHGTRHLLQSKLSAEQNRKEILECRQIVQNACGYEMRLFQPPSGDFSDTTLKVAFDLGYTNILWSADTIDWRDQDVEVITNRVLNKIAGGGFILTHPTQATVQAYPILIEKLRAMGYEFSTVGNIIGVEY